MDLRTGHAFWPISNGLINSYPPLDRDERADIAIIGAGVTGALTAYELTCIGANVIVLDRQDAGMGSSAATTGLLTYETDASMRALSQTFDEPRAVRVYRLGLEAIERIERHVHDFGDDCGFARRPSLYVASADTDADELAREHALRRAHGFEVDLLARDDIERRYGIRAPAALLSRGCGEIDCYRFIHRLLGAARRGGARVYDRTGVDAVRHAADGVVLRTSRGFDVRARRLVFATGYEAARLARGAAPNLDSTWAFISEPLDHLSAGPTPSAWADRCLIWETARPYIYMRTTRDNRVLVGGEDEPWSRRHADEALLLRKTDRLLARAREWFPRLRLEIAYRWAGVFGSTADGLPLIGAKRGHPHTWFTLGFGGNGITFGAIAALMLRDDVLGRRHPDTALFAFDRPRAKTGWRRWLGAARTRTE